MSLRAVREYLTGQIDGLSVPTIPWSLRAVSYPLPVDVLSQPTAWVWPLAARESRLGGPRFLGQKQIQHRLGVAMLWNFDPGQSDPGQFDDLVQAVVAKVRGLSLPAALSDSVSGETSQLIVIGEQMDLSYPPPQSLMSQGLLLYTAVLAVQALEVVTG